MRILVMTSVYPSPLDQRGVSTTRVVHYFARQWVEMGHEVVVVFNANQYPRVFWLLPQRLRSLLMSRLSFVPLVSDRGCDLDYEIDGVRVLRYPMLKLIPRGLFLPSQIDRQSNKIVAGLAQIGFSPDIILGHWDNPQLQLLVRLKAHYQVRTGLVFHGLRNITHPLWGRVLRRYIPSIDTIGFRSVSMQRHFHAVFGRVNKEFLCFSGIPDEYVEHMPPVDKRRKFEEGICRYIYVGSLIRRKYPDVVIRSLAELRRESGFELTIVGDGPMRSDLERLCSRLGVDHCVRFLGYRPRTEVIELMRNSDCFIMASRDEVFGLVYLEAMLQGCLVVCGKGEGIDGIIVDRVNGFTCEPGSVKQLVLTLDRIEKLGSDEKMRVSERARATALRFTDSQVARDYLDAVTSPE